MNKIIVKPLLIGKSRNLYKKDLYVSDEVSTFIHSFDRKDNYKSVNVVLLKLDYFARGGFSVDGYNIKYEWDGVYRIAIKGGKGDNREGRIIGFFDENNFIAVCSFYKNEQKLRKDQKKIIDKVSRIKRDKQWMYGIGVIMDLIKYAESVLQSTKESTVGKEYELRFDLIDFIRMKLKKSSMTQKSLAQKIKMKESQLTRILKAESNITLETVARIYHAFGCRPTITERYEIPVAVSEDRVYFKKAPIYEPQKKYMMASAI